MRRNARRIPRVRRAGPGDLPFVLRLLKRNASALGFLTRAALQEKIAKGHAWLATLDGTPAGYLVHGSLGRPEVRLFQAAVAPEAQRQHVGQALVSDLRSRAKEAGAVALSLRCLSRLAANAFWAAAGFDLVGSEPGAKDTLNIWGVRLSADPHAPGDPFAFHSRMHPCPRCGRTTADTWTAGGVRRRHCRECVHEPRNIENR